MGDHVRKIETFLRIAILFYLFIQLFSIDRFISIILNTIAPILIGVFISFLLEPLIIKLERFKLNRFGSCIIVYLLCFLCLGGISYILIPPLVKQFKDLPIDLMGMIENYNLNIVDLCLGLKDYLSHFSNIGLGVGLAFFISLDFKKVSHFYYDLAPFNYKRKYWEVSKALGHTIFMYCRYLLYDTIILFLLTSFVLWLLDISYPLAFGLCLALFNLIPYVGPILGSVPLLIYGLNEGSFMVCLGVSIGVNLIENMFISPYLLKNMIYLHPVLGVMGMCLFGSLFGFWGVVFSRLLMALMKILYSHLFLLEKNEKMVYNSSEIDDKDK